MRPDAIHDRALGALLGLAVGDALGTTLEFSLRDTLPHHTRMTGGGPFRLAPGQWTDDTAMTLALADSLIRCNGFDAHDLMTRFVAWWRTGNYSCTGTCFDIGRTTAMALERFERTGKPFAGSRSAQSAGNGSLMRLAPVALFALHEAELAIRIAQDQSRTTHAAPEAVAACTFFVTLLRDAVLGEPDVKHPRAWPGPKLIQAIAKGTWRRKSRHQIRSSGYVVDTLEAALWAVSETSSFADAVILAVNLGGDADTVGAVTGQLAGALYGAVAIPPEWLQPLAWSEKIAKACNTLLIH